MLWVILIVGVIIAAFAIPKFGKALLVLVGVALVGCLAIWAHFSDKHERQFVRPVRQITLNGIALGQHEDAVLLAKGFGSDGKVTRVCKQPVTDDRYGYSIHPDLEMRDYHVGADAKTLDRLGPRFYRSVSADRLSETRTWTEYNLAFDLEAGHIRSVCVTNSAIRFAKEHRYEEPIAGTNLRRVKGASNPEYCYEPAEKKMRPAGTCSWEKKAAEPVAAKDAQPAR